MTTTKERRITTTLSSSNQRTSERLSCRQPIRYIDKSKKQLDKKNFGTLVSPRPSPMTEASPERTASFTTTDESMSREKPLSEARSFPEVTITSLLATQESRRRRSSYSTNSGGPKSRKTWKPMSKVAKPANKQSPACKPRQLHYTRTQYRRVHGRISLSTWSLDSPSLMDTMRSS